MVGTPFVLLLGANGSFGIGKRVDDDDEPNRHRIGERFHGANFGTIAIDWDATAEGGPPAVTLAIHDVEGKVVRSVEIPAAELAPARVP